MRLLVTFAALFLSVILLQLSNGAVGPLDALSGAELGFGTGEIGLLGSAHFLGFFLGCWYAPRLMGSVGHARAFAAFTAAGTIGLISHMMVTTPLAWTVMRIGSGLCIAGCYTVIEAWLHAKVTNETRGRATGVYRVVDIGGSLVAQMMISVLAPASYVSYNILAILCCAALLPLTLSTSPAPERPEAPRLRPTIALRRSPLAVTAVIVSAIGAASFRMVGPVYGQEVGLAKDQIAWFLTAFVAGGALSQYPVGALADRFDRRWVLIWLSAAAIASSLLTAYLQTDDTRVILLSAGLFGLTTFPIYSVAAAHAHDFAQSHERIELSAALMFYYAVGAIASPLLASWLIDFYGPPAMFMMIALAHLALIVFGLIRMSQRPSHTRTRYVYAPRTTFLVGRLLGRQRDTEDS